MLGGAGALHAPPPSPAILPNTHAIAGSSFIGAHSAASSAALGAAATAASMLTAQSESMNGHNASLNAALALVAEGREETSNGVDGQNVTGAASTTTDDSGDAEQQRNGEGEGEQMQDDGEEGEEDEDDIEDEEDEEFDVEGNESASASASGRRSRRRHADSASSLSCPPSPLASLALLSADAAGATRNGSNHQQTHHPMSARRAALLAKREQRRSSVGSASHATGAAATTNSASRRPKVSLSAAPGFKKTGSKAVVDLNTGGSSCHQCKSRRSDNDLTYCTASLSKKNKNAICRKKFCSNWSVADAQGRKFALVYSDGGCDAACMHGRL